MDGNKNFFLHVWWNNKVSVNRIWYFAILMWDYSELLPSMFQLCKRCPDAQPAEQPACWGEILDTLSSWDEISHSYKVKHFCSKWGSSVLIITLITSQTFLITIWITTRQWDTKLLLPVFVIIFDTSFATKRESTQSLSFFIVKLYSSTPCSLNQS